MSDEEKKSENKSRQEKRAGVGGTKNYTTALRIAVISLVIGGLFFPLLLTGLAQVLFPYQANGELVQLNGHTVGSILIAQNFALPMFFHTRNESLSASGVDPDITLQDAYSQIPRIQNATGIPYQSIKQIVDSNVEGVYWIFGSPYVNVLKLNLNLVNNFPRIYNNASLG